MKERIYEQISRELKLATRLDLVTVIVAVAVTLLVLFPMAMVFAASSVGSITGDLTSGLSGLPAMRSATLNATPTIIMFVLLLAILAITCYAARTLMNNKKQRAKLNDGLMKLYKDEGVDQYYDGSIFKSYEARYSLFNVIITVVGALSIIIPLVIFIDQLTKL
jgi:hypothetical protein